MLTRRFAQAAQFAIALHRTQTRKATAIPYVTHLFAVCSLVLEDGGSEDEAIAAMLHDGPEDQGGTVVLEEIRTRFGDTVATIVAGLSDAMPGPGEAKGPWRERKDAYLQHLESAPPSVLRVSLADKLHNARSLLVDMGFDGEAVWERFNAGRAEQAWYYGRLLGIFRDRIAESRNLPELRRVLDDLFPQGQ
jgi:(p)ppGpp synthase/HD superfamily hydrolase